MSVQQLFDAHCAQLGWVRSEFQAGRMNETDLRDWLVRLGYREHDLDAEVDYLRNGDTGDPT